MATQKLELTWIGKENDFFVEPRVLILDEEKSYKKEKLCKETCIINSIEAKKTFYEINTRKGKNYIIPFSQISEDNKNKLSEIAALLKEHNTIKN